MEYIFYCLKSHRWYHLRWHHILSKYLHYLFYIISILLLLFSLIHGLFIPFLILIYHLYLYVWNLYLVDFCLVLYRNLIISVRLSFYVALDELHLILLWLDCMYELLLLLAFLDLFRPLLLRWYQVSPKVGFWLLCTSALLGCRLGWWIRMLRFWRRFLYVAICTC